MQIIGVNPGCCRRANDLTQIGGPGQKGKILVRGTSEKEAMGSPNNLKVGDENSQDWCGSPCLTCKDCRSAGKERQRGDKGARLRRWRWGQCARLLLWSDKSFTWRFLGSFWRIGLQEKTVPTLTCTTLPSQAFCLCGRNVFAVESSTVLYLELGEFGG